MLGYLNMEIIILAAGHGTRMQHELPKPLVPLHGKPLMSYLLQSIKNSGVCNTPVIVVSKDNRDLIKSHIGDEFRYVIQDQQLGTGHAVQAAYEELKDTTQGVMVLYADHPIVSVETLQKIAQTYQETGAMLTMATTTIPDFDGWRAGFQSFGRIIRNAAGEIRGNVEAKDATPEQLAIREVNPCYFCFNPTWLWLHLSQLQNNNAQQEYYLTDLVRMAVTEGAKIAGVTIDPKEALGCNTKEQLAVIETVLS